jgi:predicted enzyme related to lactoylglutathione lyase
MLTSSPVSATLPVVDLERAKKFYEGILDKWNQKDIQ